LIDFWKNGEHFLYIRRYDNEISSIFTTNKDKDFFNDIKQAYPKHDLKATKRNFICDKKVFGVAKRLTEAQDLKSTVQEDVKTIIFDEYPIEKNKRYYLPNESMIILGMFDSIIRNRNDVKIFILGNATEGIEFSPLFMFFELELPYNSEFKLFKDNTILVAYLKNEEFRKERENTLIGRLAKRYSIWKIRDSK